MLSTRLYNVYILQESSIYKSLLQNQLHILA